ncbi:MAG: HEAT repeat domain-containing protein [Planctomycetia bacterium]|nr:HEAT repeat domain-containing protein [Planctomycetia bacterium]
MYRAKFLLFLPIVLMLSVAGCGPSEQLYDGQPLSAFVGGIDATDPALREYATNSLIAYAPQDPRIVPALVTAMKGGSYNAANMLAQVGPTSEGKGEVVIALAEAAKSPKNSVSLRFAATNALPKFGADAKPAVPALIAMLGEPDEDMQVQATETLNKLYDTAKEAVPALVKVAKDNSKPRAQRYALAALKDIDKATYNKVTQP